MFSGLERSGMTVETEVVAKARRRRFTGAEKLRVLREADRCSRPGELGALLRREGLYSSHLSAWRAARKRGELAGLTSRPRGPKAQRPDPRERKIVELEREVKRATARAERAEGLVELQKKAAEILGTPLPESDARR